MSITFVKTLGRRAELNKGPGTIKVKNPGPERMEEIRGARGNTKRYHAAMAVAAFRGAAPIRQRSQRLRPSHILVGRPHKVSIDIGGGLKIERELPCDIILNNRQDHTKAEREHRRKFHKDYLEKNDV